MSTRRTIRASVLLLAVACSGSPSPSANERRPESSRRVEVNDQKESAVPPPKPPALGQPSPATDTLSPELRVARAWFLAIEERDAEKLGSLAASDFRAETTNPQVGCRKVTPGKGAVTCFLSKWATFVSDVALEKHEIEDTYSVPDSTEVPRTLRAACERSGCVQVKFSGDGISYIVTLVITEDGSGPKVSLMYADAEVYE